MKTGITLIAAFCAALVLTACGGGNSDSPAPEMPPASQNTTEVPASAGQSSTALVSYLGALAPADTTEALSLDKVSPTTSDTEEPQALPK